MRLPLVWLAAALAAGAQLRPAGTIPLPGVEGRIDHLAVDTARARLFVAALGNNTVEVLDLASGRRAAALKGLAEPQGLAWLPEFARLFAGNGGDGRCTIFAGSTLAAAGAVEFGDDADNVRYDAAARRVWVGYGSGALGEIDAASGRRLGDIRLAAHPESFQLERGGPRIFVNVPKAGHVAVVDRERRTVITRWATPQAAANYPMALDEGNRRLFVGCRQPAEVLVLDTGSGKVVARFACVGDTDDLFYDAERRYLYVIGGAGRVDIFQQDSADVYKPLGSIATAPGARTGLFVPPAGRLYVAVPHRGAQLAEIRIYQAAGRE